MGYTRGVVPLPWGYLPGSLPVPAYKLVLLSEKIENIIINFLKNITINFLNLKNYTLNTPYLTYYYLHEN